MPENAQYSEDAINRVSTESAEARILSAREINSENSATNENMLPARSLSYRAALLQLALLVLPLLITHNRGEALNRQRLLTKAVKVI